MSLSSDPPQQRSVVARVARLLDAISSSPVPLTLTEVASRSGLPLSTTHRLLNELVDTDLVARLDKRFVLNLHMFEIGLQIPWLRTLRETAEPLMHKYALETNQIVNLAILRASDVVYIAKVAGPGAPRVPSHVGGRLPAHCTALGKLLMAHLDPHEADRRLSNNLVRLSPYSTVTPQVLAREFAQIRAEGVAYDREEVSTGLSCVAVPVRSGDRVVAAVSVAGRTHEVPVRTDIRGLQRLAYQIGASMAASANQLLLDA